MNYIGTCLSLVDEGEYNANDLTQWTQYDPLNSPVSTFYHPAAFQIGQEEFYDLTGKTHELQCLYFYNAIYGVAFAYDPAEDLHFFYK